MIMETTMTMIHTMILEMDQKVTKTGMDLMWLFKDQEEEILRSQDLTTILKSNLAILWILFIP